MYVCVDNGTPKNVLGVTNDPQVYINESLLLDTSLGREEYHRYNRPYLLPPSRFLFENDEEETAPTSKKSPKKSKSNRRRNFTSCGPTSSRRKCTDNQK